MCGAHVLCSAHRHAHQVKVLARGEGTRHGKVVCVDGVRVAPSVVRLVLVVIRLAAVAASRDLPKRRIHPWSSAPHRVVNRHRSHVCLPEAMLSVLSTGGRLRARTRQAMMGRSFFKGIFFQSNSTAQGAFLNGSSYARMQLHKGLFKWTFIQLNSTAQGAFQKEFLQPNSTAQGPVNKRCCPISVCTKQMYLLAILQGRRTQQRLQKVGKSRVKNCRSRDKAGGSRVTDGRSRETQSALVVSTRMTICC